MSHEKKTKNVTLIETNRIFNELNQNSMRQISQTRKFNGKKLLSIHFSTFTCVTNVNWKKLYGINARIRVYYE